MTSLAETFPHASEDIRRLNPQLFPEAREASSSPAPREEGAARLLEADVQGAGIDLLRWHPMVAFVRRFNSGAILIENEDGSKRAVRLGEEFDPDVIAILRPNGRFMAIEFKRPGEEATEGQIGRLQDLAEAGAVCAVIDQVEQLEDLLEEVTKEYFEDRTPGIRRQS